MIFLKREHPKKLKITTRLTFVFLFFTLGYAMMESFFSIYMVQIYDLSKSEIGYIASLAMFFALLISFFFSVTLERFHEKKLLYLSMASLVVLYSFLAFNKSVILLIIIFVLIRVFQAVRTNSLGILYRDNSKDKELNKNEGFLYAVYNLAWFLAPILAGFFLLKYEIQNLFLFGSSFLLAGFLYYSILDVKDGNHKTKRNEKTALKEMLLNIKSFFSNTLYVKSYLIVSGIYIWWGVVYIFTPLEIIENNLGDSAVAVFMALVLLPVVLSEYKTALLVEKLGFKKTFFIGYIIIILATAMAFFLDDIHLKLTALIIGAFGTAFIEPLKDILFFKNTDGEDEEKHYSIFNSSAMFGSLVGGLIFGSFFYFVSSISYAYLLLAAIMALFLIPIFKLKNI